MLRSGTPTVCRMCVYNYNFECGNTVVDVSLMQRGIVLALLALHVHSTAPVSTKGVDRWSVKQVSVVAIGSRGGNRPPTWNYRRCMGR
jgi:hypothetical protein